MADLETQSEPARTPLRKRRWFRALMAAARIALACLVLLAILVRLVEKRLIYHPSREGDWEAPSRSGLAVEDVSLTTAHKQGYTG